MKRLFYINIKKVLLYSGLIAVIFLAECGLNLNGVDVPEYGEANQVATFTMHCGVEPRITDGTYTAKLLIGFLAPKSWHVAQNTVMTFTSPKGNGTLSVIPAGQKEPNTGLEWPDAAKIKLGIGGNLSDDVEWVIFQSALAYTFSNNEDITFDVVIKSKLGTENTLVKLGFYYGNSKENLNGDANYTKTYYTNCFSVINGEGDIADFCNPQLSVVSPGSSLDNDIVTLTYDNGIVESGLSNTDDIYLCATAYTTTGVEKPICEQTAKTKLTPLGGKKYRIDLWPRVFFNVRKGETLDHIEYYYTDASGSIRIGYANTSDPFRYTFKCAD